jgi:hypothetical protein
MYSSLGMIRMHDVLVRFTAIYGGSGVHQRDYLTGPDTTISSAITQFRSERTPTPHVQGACYYYILALKRSVCDMLAYDPDKGIPGILVNPLEGAYRLITSENDQEIWRNIYRNALFSGERAQFYVIVVEGCLELLHTEIHPFQLCWPRDATAIPIDVFILNGYQAVSTRAIFNIDDDLNAFMARVLHSLDTRKVKTNWSNILGQEGSLDDVIPGDLYVIGEELRVFLTMLTYLSGCPGNTLSRAAPTLHWAGPHRYRSLENALRGLPPVSVVILNNRCIGTPSRSPASSIGRQGARHTIHGACPLSPLGTDVLDEQMLDDYVIQHIHNTVNDIHGCYWGRYHQVGVTPPRLEGDSYAARLTSGEYASLVAILVEIMERRKEECHDETFRA